MAWWDSSKQRQSLGASQRPKKRLVLGDAFPRLQESSRLSTTTSPTMDEDRGFLSPVFEDHQQNHHPVAPLTPALVVHVEIQFTDPVIRSRYSRSYGSSPLLEPSKRICDGLLRRIERCSEELLTRKDSGALEALKDETNERKPLRFEMKFRILRRGGGEWAERTFRSYQKQPLTVGLTKGIILASHRMVGLFLRRHDKDFQWLDQPFYDTEPESPETVAHSPGAPLSLSCIPRSRFIEPLQSFEVVPGYGIEILFRSRYPLRKKVAFEKGINVNSKQTAPLTLFMSEDLLWKVLQAINHQLDPIKQEFDAHLKTCGGLDCSHAEDDALDIDLRVSNNLGPVYSQVRRNVKSTLALFRDPDASDCEAFLRAIEAALADESREMDAKINATEDFELRVLEVKGVGWALQQPTRFAVGSLASYSRCTIQAALDRVQTGMGDVIRGRNVAVHVSAYKRGHLILDKAIVAHEKRGKRREKFAFPEDEGAAIVARLKIQIQRDIDMVFNDTCSIDDIAEEQEEQVAMPLMDSIESMEIETASPEKRPVSARREYPFPSNQNSQHNRTLSLPRPQSSPRPLIQRAFSLSRRSIESINSEKYASSLRAEATAIHHAQATSPARPQSSSSPLAQRAFSFPRDSPDFERTEAPVSPLGQSASLPRPRSSVRRLVQRAFSLTRRSTESLRSRGSSSKLNEDASASGARSSRSSSITFEQGSTQLTEEEISPESPTLVAPRKASRRTFSLSSKRYSLTGRVSNASTLIEELPDVDASIVTSRDAENLKAVKGENFETKPTYLELDFGEDPGHVFSNKLGSMTQEGEADKVDISPGIDPEHSPEPLSRYFSPSPTDLVQIICHDGDSKLPQTEAVLAVPVAAGISLSKMDTPEAFEDAAEFVSSAESEKLTAERSPNLLSGARSPRDDEFSTAPSTPALSHGGDASPSNSLLLTTPQYMRARPGTKESVLKKVESELESDKVESYKDAVTHGDPATASGEGTEERGHDTVHMGPTSLLSSSSPSSETTDASDVPADGPDVESDSARRLDDSSVPYETEDNQDSETQSSPSRTPAAKSEPEESPVSEKLGADGVGEADRPSQSPDIAGPDLADFPTEVRDSEPTSQKAVKSLALAPSSETSSVPERLVEFPALVDVDVGGGGGGGGGVTVVGGVVGGEESAPTDLVSHPHPAAEPQPRKISLADPELHAVHLEPTSTSDGTDNTPQDGCQQTTDEPETRVSPHLGEKCQLVGPATVSTSHDSDINTANICVGHEAGGDYDSAPAKHQVLGSHGFNHVPEVDASEVNIGDQEEIGSIHEPESGVGDGYESVDPAFRIPVGCHFEDHLDAEYYPDTRVPQVIAGDIHGSASEIPGVAAKLQTHQESTFDLGTGIPVGCQFIEYPDAEYYPDTRAPQGFAGDVHGSASTITAEGQVDRESVHDSETGIPIGWRFGEHVDAKYYPDTREPQVSIGEVHGSASESPEPTTDGQADHESIYNSGTGIPVGCQFVEDLDAKDYPDIKCDHGSVPKSSGVVDADPAKDVAVFDSGTGISVESQLAEPLSTKSHPKTQTLEVLVGDNLIGRDSTVEPPEHSIASQSDYRTIAEFGSGIPVGVRFTQLLDAKYYPDTHIPESSVKGSGIGFESVVGPPEAAIANQPDNKTIDGVGSGIPVGAQFAHYLDAKYYPDTRPAEIAAETGGTGHTCERQAPEDTVGDHVDDELILESDVNASETSVAFVDQAGYRTIADFESGIPVGAQFVEYLDAKYYPDTEMPEPIIQHLAADVSNNERKATIPEPPVEGCSNKLLGSKNHPETNRLVVLASHQIDHEFNNGYGIPMGSMFEQHPGAKFYPDTQAPDGSSIDFEKAPDVPVEVQTTHTFSDGCGIPIGSQFQGHPDAQYYPDTRVSVPRCRAQAKKALERPAEAQADHGSIEVVEETPEVFVMDQLEHQSIDSFTKTPEISVNTQADYGFSDGSGIPIGSQFQEYLDAQFYPDTSVSMPSIDAQADCELIGNFEVLSKMSVTPQAEYGFNEGSGIPLGAQFHVNPNTEYPDVSAPQISAQDQVPRFGIDSEKLPNAPVQTRTGCLYSTGVGIPIGSQFQGLFDYPDIREPQISAGHKRKGDHSASTSPGIKKYKTSVETQPEEIAGPSGNVGITVTDNEEESSPTEVVLDGQTPQDGPVKSEAEVIPTLEAVDSRAICESETRHEEPVYQSASVGPEETLEIVKEVDIDRPESNDEEPIEADETTIDVAHHERAIVENIEVDRSSSQPTVRAETEAKIEILEPEVLNNFTEAISNSNSEADVSEPNISDEGRTSAPDAPEDEPRAQPLISNTADGTSEQRTIVPEVPVKEAPTPHTASSKTDKSDFSVLESHGLSVSENPSTPQKTEKVPTKPAADLGTTNGTLIAPLPLLSTRGGVSSVPQVLEYQPYLTSARGSVEDHRPVLADEHCTPPSASRKYGRPQTAGYLGLHREPGLLDVGLRGALSGTRRFSLPPQQNDQEACVAEDTAVSVAKSGKDRKHDIWQKTAKASAPERHRDADDAPVVLSRIMMLLAGAVAISKILKRSSD
ncbi:hypothetical protein B0H63DRAFT_42253 [Podospora didyma]|uniref:Pt repeat family protein n=1 Tax=Podospora didyma TaxID=330526 RepID=A0AAE0P6M6_9PEZI|nr:hypothetical protein B0H63DRAFT_42253 [Podospora didyma]